MVEMNDAVPAVMFASFAVSVINTSSVEQQQSQNKCLTPLCNYLFLLRNNDHLLSDTMKTGSLTVSLSIEPTVPRATRKQPPSHRYICGCSQKRATLLLAMVYRAIAISCLFCVAANVLCSILHVERNSDSTKNRRSRQYDLGVNGRTFKCPLQARISVNGSHITCKTTSLKRITLRGSFEVCT